MSYILDALRRAEVERQRGKVPVLHAVHDGAVTVGAVPDGDRRVVLPAGLAVVTMLLLLAVAAGAWLIGRRGASAEPAARAPIVAAADAPTGAVSTVNPTALAPVISASAIERPVSVTGANARLAPVLAASPLPALTGATVRPSKLQGSAPDRADQVSAALASGPPSQPALAAAAAVERVPGLAELPEDFRRQLPTIALAGGMYSELATQRLVIVNGSVVREGDQPATDLRVVQIRPRAVVFSFRGQLFVVNL
jgi:general secretion pathway protein B